MNKNGQKKVVCIGGGTGTFVVLKGLKYFPVTLNAIVTMSDSGGSNKRIRDEFGLLPTSDIRQCFVALSEERGGAGLLRRLFMYRFEKGRGITGMTFGNLFMAALSEILGSQEEAIKQTGKVLRIHGNVIPVSFTDTNLYAQYEDGHTVGEEHLIDEPSHDGKIAISRVYLKPKAKANPEAVNAILTADIIILGPGDLYTSVVPNLLVDQISGALQKSRARKIFVMNLMTKYGQTYGFTASKHLQVIESLIGQKITHVIVNTGKLHHNALAIYAKSDEVPVINDLNKNSYYELIEDDVVGSQMVDKSQSDVLVRSLIRHDSDKLAAVIAKCGGFRV